MPRPLQKVVTAVFVDETGAWSVRGKKQIIPCTARHMQLRLRGGYRLDVAMKDTELRVLACSFRSVPWFLPGMSMSSWQRITAAVSDTSQDLSLIMTVSSDKFEQRRAATPRGRLLLEMGDPVQVIMRITGRAFDRELIDPAAGYRNVVAQAGRLQLMTIEM